MDKIPFSWQVFAFTSWTHPGQSSAVQASSVSWGYWKADGPCRSSFAHLPTGLNSCDCRDRLGTEVLGWHGFCCNGWADYGSIPSPQSLRYNRGVNQAPGVVFVVVFWNLWGCTSWPQCSYFEKLPPTLKFCCPPQQLNLWYLLPLWNLCPSDFLGEKFEDWERTLKINCFSGSLSSCLMTFSLCDALVLFTSTWLLVSTKKTPGIIVEAEVQLVIWHCKEQERGWWVLFY